MPYTGFSAGAAIAVTTAVIGGWRYKKFQACPEDAGEGFEDVTVVRGRGLVRFTVEVHVDTWDTTPRLIAALQVLSRGAIGYAIDENIALVDRRLHPSWGCGASVPAGAPDDPRRVRPPVAPPPTPTQGAKCRSVRAFERANRQHRGVAGRRRCKRPCGGPTLVVGSLV